MRTFFDYRLKFSKNGPVRFVGHLDVVRYLQKANRRAGLPMSYSEGFSPHQILSVALPLPVGATSDGEYLDMRLEREMDPAEIVTRLNAVMHEGIEARDCILLPEHAPKAMTVITAGSYRLQLRDSALRILYGEDGPADRFPAELRAHLEQPSISVLKEGKKGPRTVDIKPFIHEWSVDENGTVTALLHAGSRDHVKPSFLFEGLFQNHGKEFSPQMLMVHRLDLYETPEASGTNEQAERSIFVPLIPPKQQESKA